MSAPTVSRLRFLIVLVLLSTGLLRAQTTITYTDTQTDSTALTTTGSDPLTLFIDTSAAIATQSGLISGDGSLTKTGDGTLVLSVANTYTGGTVLDDGTLGLGADNALGSGTLTINGGTLRAANAGRTLTNTVILNGDFTLGRLTNFSGPITLTNNITLTSANPDTSTPNTSMFSGVISGAYGLTFIDGVNPIGTIILSADNTYTGGTTLSSGTLQIGNGGTTGSITGDILDNGTLTFYRSDSFAYAGNISGTGSLIKYGTDLLTLSGSNTYSGGTTINGGFVNFSSLANFGTGTVSLANGGGLQWATGNTADISSRLIVGNYGLLDTNGNDVTFASTLASLSDGQLYKAGAGTLTLTGISDLSTFGILQGGVIFAPGTYSGSLSVGDEVAGSSASPSPTSATLSGVGVTWTTKSDHVTLGDLTVGNNNQDSSSLTLSDGATASFLNSYIGSQSVGTTTLTVTGLGTTLTNTGILYLGFANTSTVSLVISGGASFSTQNTFIGDANTGSASLTLTGPGSTFTNIDTILVVAENSGSNGTINIGSAAGDAATAAGILDTATVYGGNGTATLQFNTTGTALAPTYFTRDGTANSASINTSGLLTLINTAGTTVITGDLDHTGDTIINGGTLQIGDGGVNGGIASDITDDSALIFDVTSALYCGGVISGTGTVTQSGTGTTILAGANTYTGGTFVTAGLVSFTTLANFGTGSITLNGGGLEWAVGNTLDISSRLAALGSAGATFNTGSNKVTFATALTGTGALIKTGTSALTLSADNTYSGNTTISAGSLVVTGTLGDGDYSGNITNAGVLNFASSSDQALSGAIANGGVLLFSSSADLALSGILSGAGSLIQSGTGTLTLSGVNTYSGSTTLSSGTLSVSSNSALGSSLSALIINGGTLATTASLTSARAITFNSGGGTIAVSDGQSTLLSGTLHGTGALIKSGLGTLTLSGTDIYTGNTTVSAGTLIINSSLSQSALTVNSGATLGGHGTLDRLTTITSGAHLAPGGGTLTFTAGLALNDGAILDLQLGTTSDKILITGGTLSGDAGGTITINLTDSGDFAGGTFDLIDATSASLSNIDASDFALGTTLAGYDYSLAMDGNVLQLTATTAIPEPATYALLLGALTLALALHKRRTALRH